MEKFVPQGGVKFSSEAVKFRDKKSRYQDQRCPYRKPTQVDEERILRRARELLLRNSAKLPRNFGKRGAYYGRSQRIGPSNCLPKTQVSAKSKDDV